MQVKPNNPPREFDVKPGSNVRLKDCGRISLDADEQVTFITLQGGEYDVVRKSWGFYATPSVDGRLPRFGLRTALAKSATGKHYVLLVEKARQAEFDQYLEKEQMWIVAWLDEPEVLEALGRETGGQ